MSAPAIMRALLSENMTLQSMVSGRIYVGVLPQGALLPAVGVSEISSNEMDTVARNSPTVVVTSRVQVTAFTRSYAAQKALIHACKLAGGTHTGTIAGYKVLEIQRQSVGPDMPVEDDGVYEQSRDFMVVFIEPN